jgi:hypothetical protein
MEGVTIADATRTALEQHLGTAAAAPAIDVWDACHASRASQVAA